MSMNQLAKLPTEIIRSILFEYYLATDKTIAYNNINVRSLRFKAKMNDSISEEGYIIWEGILEVQDKYLHYRKLSDNDEEEIRI